MELPLTSVIYPNMRHIILVLMIALVPMRLWAADMMAVSMAAQQLSAAQPQQSAQLAPLAIDGQNSLAPSDSQAQMRMTTDCPMMFLLAGKQVGDTGDTSGSTVSKVCTTCQLCMGLVSGYAPCGQILTPLPPAALWLGTVTFISAERAPGFKPPIS